MLFPIYVSGLVLSTLPILAPATFPPICPLHSKPSCSANAEPSCCFNSPGGQMLLTQYWDTNPAAGPPKSWIIHGLWPDHCDGTYDQYCDSSREYTNISSILTQHDKKHLLDYMIRYWPDWHGEHEQFWDHEFGKHATCINTLDPSCYHHYKPQEEVVDYFERTVSLFQSLNTYEILGHAGIWPSKTKTYTYDRIMSAVRRARGVNATFQCSDGELNEMWYTFEVRGNVQTGIFVPREPIGESSDCPMTEIKYLPKNLSSYYTMEPLVTTSTAAPVGVPTT